MQVPDFQHPYPQLLLSLCCFIVENDPHPNVYDTCCIFVLRFYSKLYFFTCSCQTHTPKTQSQDIYLNKMWDVYKNPVTGEVCGAGDSGSHRGRQAQIADCLQSSEP